MNILDFLNSKDVRDYLKEIDYKFSLLEQAYIIYKSRFKSLEEKKKAYTELVDSTEDYILGSDGNRRWIRSEVKGQSVHSLILKYVDVLDECVDLFYKMNSGEYCQVEFILDAPIQNQYERNKIESGYIFANVEGALTYALEEVRDIEEPFCNKYIGFEIIKGCCKRPDVDDVNKVYAIFNLNGTLLSIDYSNGFYRDGIDIEQDFFEQMWFDIPIPFKRGDIVRGSFCNWGSTTEPFVLLNTYPEMKREAKEKTGKYSEGCDASDMNASGWSTGFYEDNPLFINDDVMADYLDLEYYRDGFEGPQRLLPLMAREITGEIDVWTYTYAYRQIVSEYMDYISEKEMGKFIMNSDPIYSVLGGEPYYEQS